MLVASHYQDSGSNELVMVRCQALFGTHRTVHLHVITLSTNVVN